MKTEVVLKNENRVVCQTQDGTTFEFSGNPKTGIAQPWVKLAANEPHLHVHVETASGRLLTPGAVLNRRRIRSVWLFVLAVAIGVVIGCFHDEIVENVKSWWPDSQKQTIKTKIEF